MKPTGGGAVCIGIRVHGAKLYGFCNLSSRYLTVRTVNVGVLLANYFLALIREGDIQPEFKVDGMG